VTELFLIRHARAADHAANDWERPLVPEGRREARTVGAALARQGVKWDAIAVSPLVRAVETATLMAVELGYEGALTVDHALAPDGMTPAMLGVAERLSGCIALVGHEPSMGQLLSDLLNQPGMVMVKGGVARLAFDGPIAVGAGRLLWSMSPRQLTPARGG
jgi:phosphohistidine phosphatase